MKIITANPIIIDEEKVSPSDEYLNISGSDNSEAIRQFQIYANKRGYSPKLPENGIWTTDTANAAKIYGADFDSFAKMVLGIQTWLVTPYTKKEPPIAEQEERKKRGEFWNKAKGAWEKVQDSGLLQSVGNLLSRGRQNPNWQQQSQWGSQPQRGSQPPVDTRRQRNTNTALIVGGILVVGIVAFVALRKKK